MEEIERGSRRYQKNWLRKERRAQEIVPSVRVRKVKVGREESSVVGTVRATCSIGEFSEECDVEVDDWSTSWTVVGKLSYQILISLVIRD